MLIILLYLVYQLLIQGNRVRDLCKGDQKLVDKAHRVMNAIAEFMAPDEVITVGKCPSLTLVIQISHWFLNIYVS